MSEKISNDFLSKENIAHLYKEITLVNEYTNLNKQQKDIIITNLIETMKRIYKTLDFTKINNSNILNIKKQFSSIVVKQTSDLIKNYITKADDNQHSNQKNADKLFTSVKKPNVVITSVDRPASNNTIPPQMKVSEDFIKKTSGDISSRLAELESSRRVNNNTKPTDIPDFLKPVKVGREDTFGSSNTNNLPERKLEGLEGFGDMQDNFKENNNTDLSKYSDNMSLQDRLQKLEAERGGMSIPPASQQAPQQQMPQYQAQQQYQQAPQQVQVPQQYQKQVPQQYQQVPQYQAQPHQQQYQAPPHQQHQQHQHQHQQQYQQHQHQQQYQAPQQAPRQPMNNNQSDELFQQLNEMKMMLTTLKDENNHLKHQMKTKQSMKTLQLDINKTQPLYKFQFNPINNIVGIKLLSYNLPQPVYNIFDNSNFVYEMNDIQHQIIIQKGHYNIEALLNILNNNKDLIFSIDYTLKVSVKSKDEISEFIIKPTFISLKLGFNSEDKLSSNKIAYKIYDLRLQSKLLFFIKNINPNPICILNFNNTSVCNLQFNSPLSLSSLDLEFYTEDNILYNFNDIAYNLSFALDIIE